MRIKSNRKRWKQRRRKLRSGAILLDLFLATLIFATCVLAIGQLGSQSLQLANTNALERLAAIKAESTLAEEIARGPKNYKPRVWRDVVQGIPFSLRATWSETKQPHLFQVAVDVSRADSFTPSLVSYSRLVFIEGR